MMKRFISKVSMLIALVVVLASCEVRRWEETPVEYRTVYCINYGQTLSSDQSDIGMVGVYKYHLYFDSEPYALITFSDDTVIKSITEIYDFVDSSGYLSGTTTYQYSFKFTEKVRTRGVDGTITTSLRYYEIEGPKDPDYKITSSEVVITDGYDVYGDESTDFARITTLSRPYDDGFVGYDDYSVDLYVQE